jgi:hypothetical protein
MSHVGSQVYPTLEEVMNLARSIVNDAFQGGAGRILTDAAPFTIPYVNASVRRLQNYLANNGVSSNIRDNFIWYNIPVVQNPNPAIQVSIGYTGYTQTGSATLAVPALPPDLIVPFDLSERLTGSNAQFGRMDQPQSGLPSRNQKPILGDWEWRHDSIWMVGATSARDVRMRYEAVIQPFAAGVNFSTTVVPIMDSIEPLAYRIAYMYATARGAQQAPALALEYQQAAAQIVVRYSRRDQRIQFNRRPFGNCGGGVPIGTYKS